jgi:molybdate transport system ATP-binding protein
MIALSFTRQQGDFTLSLDTRLDGRVTALFGPSGSGKTTILDTIAGLRRPQSGTVAIGSRVLFSSERDINLAPHHRHVGYVPQDVALFPHMNVRRNVLYGRREGQRLDLDGVARILEVQSLLERGVAQLSGGERQRVALARALMSSPELLLLDEPLAAVDVELRRRIIPYLVRVRDELGVQIIYVTHDRSEVALLADEVLVLQGGKAVQHSAVADWQADVPARPAKI